MSKQLQTTMIGVVPASEEEWQEHIKDKPKYQGNVAEEMFAHDSGSAGDSEDFTFCWDLMVWLIEKGEEKRGEILHKVRTKRIPCPRVCFCRRFRRTIKRLKKEGKDPREFYWTRYKPGKLALERKVT